jgi:hypothetical protein
MTARIRIRRAQLAHTLRAVPAVFDEANLLAAVGLVHHRRVVGHRLSIERIPGAVAERVPSLPLEVQQRLLQILVAGLEA